MPITTPPTHTLFLQSERGSSDHAPPASLPSSTALRQVGSGPLGKLRLRLRGPDLENPHLLGSSTDLSGEQRSPRSLLCPCCPLCVWAPNEQSSFVQVDPGGPGRPWSPGAVSQAEGEGKKTGCGWLGSDATGGDGGGPSLMLPRSAPPCLGTVQGSMPFEPHL